MILVCLFVPRGFCGYVCPLGTLIDLFDRSIGNRWKRLKIKRDGWWVHLRYYVLTACLAASLCGVLITGFLAAIPLITRGMLHLLTPLGIGVTKGWHLVPPIDAGQALSVALLLVVLGLGLLRPRFWCRYLCPTGAVFSAANMLRLTERKVEATCGQCAKCARICPVDAIKADFTTRPDRCTFCQTCGGVCDTGAIKFVPRWDTEDLKVEEESRPLEAGLSRRGFLAGTAAGGAALAGIRVGYGADRFPHPVRPPGSVPEEMFLRVCIRCGECVNACPTNVLRPMSFEQGLEGLWTPRVVADWSGCEPSCNACGKVCPTGAIRALPLEEKRVARMGLAAVDRETCLPHAGREACQLCVDQCSAAGYDAIEFERVGLEIDEEGYPVEDTGFLAPVVAAERCVGCGLCQTRCYSINAKEKRLLERSAIEVFAGPGKEDRIRDGSYTALREQERIEKEKRLKEREQESGGDGGFLPDFLD